METVFSHIVQRRFSQVNEDVATDALAFILRSGEAARLGMMKLLCGIVPDLPGLYFRTQQPAAKGTMRPDMAGYHEAELRVYIENKFWAGLTDNQPVSYLRQLSHHTQPTLLLMVVPAQRETLMWREVRRRLHREGIALLEQDASAGAARSIQTELGPTLALVSWAKLLSALELEAGDDQGAKSDILQLRALCEAADSEAFVPISLAEATDLRTPAFILRLVSIVQAVADSASSDGVISVKRLLPQSDWERIGRYALFPGQAGFGVWFGIHFGLWRKHGGTPLWLIFNWGEWGRAAEAQRCLEPWAAKEDIFTTTMGDGFAVAMDLEAGEDKDRVIKAIVDRLAAISSLLTAQATRTAGNA